MTITNVDQLVDARGLACPMPIVKSAQAMKVLASGQVLEVLATDAGSVRDFQAWSRSTGNALIEMTEEAGTYRFLLQKK
jgi:tRNA 2-thiouridine synthesizing protein A